MKRLIAWLLVLVMTTACCLTACTPATDQPSGTSKPVVTTEKPVIPPADGPLAAAGEEWALIQNAFALVMKDMEEGTSGSSDITLPEGPFSVECSLDLAPLLGPTLGDEAVVSVKGYVDTGRTTIVASLVSEGQAMPLLTVEIAEDYGIVNCPMLYPVPLKITGAELEELLGNLLGGMIPGGGEDFPDFDEEDFPAYDEEDFPDFDEEDFPDFDEEDYPDFGDEDPIAGSGVGAIAPAALLQLMKLMGDPAVQASIEAWATANAESLAAAVAEFTAKLTELVQANRTFTVPNVSETVAFPVGDTSVLCHQMTVTVTAAQLHNILKGLRDYLAGENSLRPVVQSFFESNPAIVEVLSLILGDVSADRLMGLLVAGLDEALGDVTPEELVDLGSLEASFFLSATDLSLVGVELVKKDQESEEKITLTLGENVMTSPVISLVIVSENDTDAITLIRNKDDKGQHYIVTVTENGTEKAAVEATVTDSSFSVALRKNADESGLFSDAFSLAIAGHFSFEENGRFCVVIDSLKVVNGEKTVDLAPNLTIALNPGDRCDPITDAKPISELTDEEWANLREALNNLLSLFQPAV